MKDEIEGVKLVLSAYDNIPRKGYDVIETLTDEFGFIYVKDNVIEVAIRGTETMRDWITDANANIYRSPYGGVHHGGWIQYRRLSSSLMLTIQHYCITHNVKKINIRGHSMGTWIATFLAVELADLNPALCLYAPPKIGNIDFVQFVRKLKLKINSYGSRYDLVVKNPIYLSHIEAIQYLDFVGIDHGDELGNHSLENFIPAFERYL